MSEVRFDASLFFARLIDVALDRLVNQSVDVLTREQRGRPETRTVFHRRSDAFQRALFLR